MSEDAYEWRRENERTLARYVDPHDLPPELHLPTSRNDVFNSEGGFALAEQLYELICKQVIQYEYESIPSSSEKVQEIRKPKTILGHKRGNCLDLAILFATMCLDNYLFPLVVVVEGHAFAGLSLKRRLENEWVRRSGSYMWDRGMLTDLTSLQQLADSGEYLFIECTGAAQSMTMPKEFPEGERNENGFILPFTEALKVGNKQVKTYLRQNNAPKTPGTRAFLYALDISDLHKDPEYQPPGSLYTAEQVHSLLEQDKKRTSNIRLLKPHMHELFEIINDSNKILPVLFRTEPGKSLAPYDIDYVNGREGVVDVQVNIKAALLNARDNKLLIQGPSGIGKTREVAELATTLCEEGWTVCLAKSEGDEHDPDAHLGALDSFPTELNDAPLLLIFDNLYQRVARRVEKQAPYPDRLEALFASIRRTKPWFVIAISPTELQYQEQLNFEPTRAPWNRFEVYDLPEFTLAGQKQILISVATKLNVAVEDADAQAFVEDSDHKPITFITNVQLARDKNRPLGDHWYNAVGLSWKEWFSLAQKSYPTADKVYQALYLLRRSGLPTRMVYVTKLSGETQATVEGLVAWGLLGLRGEILTVLSEEQIEESMSGGEVKLLNISKHWDDIIKLVYSIDERPQGWLGDLIVLASSLIGAKAFDRAEEVATFAIQQGNDTAEAFFYRHMARLPQGKYAEAESDLDMAIRRGKDTVEVYFDRATVRFLQNKYMEAASDLDIVIERGDKTKTVYVFRALMPIYQSKLHGNGD